jgi:hypothetical protein
MPADTDRPWRFELNWSPWCAYTYEEVQRVVPVEAGVHTHAVKLRDVDNVRFFYIGQSDDLYLRLKEYLSDRQKNECVKGNVSKFVSRFRDGQMSSQVERDEAERAVFGRFKPECSDRDAIPEAEEVEVNF